MPKKPAKSRAGRSDFEDREDREQLRGLVRHLRKRVKALERENSRLTKYLIHANYEADWSDPEEPVIKSPRNGESDWKCVSCGSTDHKKLDIPRLNCIIRYITCDGCGIRSKVTLDEQPVDSGGE